MPTSKKEYWVADWIKLLSAIMVVAIHTGLVISIKSMWGGVAIEFAESLAVPTFFCITGYLLEEKISQELDKESLILKANLIKYVKLYLSLSALYLPLTFYGIYQQVLENESFVKVLFNVIKNYILVGEQFYSWQLWYLLSTIFGLIVLLLIPRRDFCRLLIYSSIFLGVAIVINMFSDVRIIGLTVVNGRLLTGPSYIMLGIAVSRKKEFFNKKFGLLLVILMCGISVTYNLSYSTTSIVAFLTVPWIVGFIMEFQSFDSLSNKSRICRKISSIIYYSHMYFLFIWMYLLPIKEKGVDCFLFVIGLSFLFSVLVLWLKNKIWHRYLTPFGKILNKSYSKKERRDKDA